MRRDRWLALILTGVVGSSTPSLAQSPDSALQPLFDQAEFWQSRQRGDLAEETLKRVLVADPDNPEALYRLGLLALNDRDTEAANQWLAKLRAAAPNDPRIERLAQAKISDSIDSAGLAKARALTQSGNPQGAIREYDRVLGGQEPPWSLAAEYYETLAGTDEGWERARQALQRLHQRDPDDRTLALALDRVLSYRAETRRDAIDRLSQLSPGDASRKAWRQALLWLDATADDQGLYERYLQRYPDDQAVREYFLAKTAAPEADPEAEARQQGYQALEAGQLANARAQFDKALKGQPNDAEALAGAGLVALRRQQFAEARDKLGRAIQLDPSRADDWRDAFRNASFYAELAAVRRLAADEKWDDALKRVAPLTREDGREGHAARLLEADLLRRSGEDAQAEQRYRQLLAANANDTDAAVGLAGVLRDQKRWDEANDIAQRLPEAVRASLGDPRRDQAQQLRDQARRLMAQGRPESAKSLLSQALELTPDDPWIRLDLARLYQSEGKPYQASFVMSPVLGDSAEPEALYAGALLASEQERWDDADSLLSRIPGNEWNDEMDKLRSRLAFQRRLSSLTQRLAAHDPAARQALFAWYRNPPSEPAEVGSVALALADAGQPGMGLQMVRDDLARADIGEQPTAYLTHALVLAKAGRIDESRTLLGKIEAASTAPEQRLQVSATQRGIAVIEADRLRQQQRYAEAYDVLQPQLQSAPEDTALLLALGRLYTSGDMPEAAGKVYDHLLESQPQDEQVVAGAVNAALANGDSDRAQQLLVDHAPLHSPQLVILAARTARAQGDREQAITLLEQARSRQLAAGGGDWLLPATASAGESLTMPGNPFRRTQQATRTTAAELANTSWMPGHEDIGAEDSRNYSSRDSSSRTRAGSGSEASDPTLAEIDRLLAELHEETATHLTPNANLRLRDGEEGLSELTSLGSSLTLSAVPFKRGRLEISLSPEYVSAGEASSNANERYGKNVFVSAAETLGSRLGNVSSVLSEIQGTVDNFLSIEELYSQNEDSAFFERQYDQAGENLLAALSRNPLYESGIDIASLSQIQKEQLQTKLTDILTNHGLSENSDRLSSDISKLFEIEDASDLSDIDLSAYGITPGNIPSPKEINAIAAKDPNVANYIADLSQQRIQYEQSLARIQQAIDSRLAGVPRAARDPKSITDAGVGLDIGYRIGEVAADIGATPLGFEKSNVVGGIAWQPRLSENTQLSLKAERRAVADSVLSYAGVKDPLTGETWGAVTRTGGSVGIAYDNGASGAYASAGAYQYRGEHVADNHAIEANTGAFVRPINEPDRQLQIGVNLGYMAFDKNLRYFTYGHGGYFSPQDYVSLSFPVSFQQQQDRWRYRLSAAPGFQSYSEDDADYFPEDGDAQALLETLVDAGLATDARYSGESKSGFGITLGGDVSYQLAPDLSVGGAMSYDSFGNYSETSAQVYLNYRLGAAK